MMFGKLRAIHRQAGAIDWLGERRDFRDAVGNLYRAIKVIKQYHRNSHDPVVRALAGDILRTLHLP